MQSSDDQASPMPSGFFFA